jgi:hypothetical protein
VGAKFGNAACGKPPDHSSANHNHGLERPIHLRGLRRTIVLIAEGPPQASNVGVDGLMPRTPPSSARGRAVHRIGRLQRVNRAFMAIEAPRSVVGRPAEKIEGLLGASGANLLYAGYPYDPFATDATKS